MIDYEKKRKIKRIKRVIETISITLLILLVLLSYIFFERGKSIIHWNPWIQFSCMALFLISINSLFNFKSILFDNEEYKKNATIPALVEKIRFRAVLFNNIAIILFLMILSIIIISFYLVFRANPNSNGIQYDSITIRISGTVILIFLVQVLFRVFKYLLRVAAFYNARADAIEFDQLSNKLSLDKSMDLFTPDKYDISELENASIIDGITKFMKGK